MQGVAEVRLVFAGEVLEGFQVEEVRHRFGEAFKLAEPQLIAMFSGERTVLKRAISVADAARYVAQLQKLGARVHIEELAVPPLASPAVAAVPVPVSPVPLVQPVVPALAVLAPIEEEIVCPTCGERQSKRILCRSCATDMPRGIAAKKEDEDRERAERLEEARARRGFRPPASDVGFARGAEDAPGLLGIGFEGRMGRINYLASGLVFMVVLLLAALGVALWMVAQPNVFAIVVAAVALIALLVWSVRNTVLRLHDVNLSGWWALVSLVPYLGPVASLVLMFVPGSRDENDHGGLPRRGSPLAVGVGLLVLVIVLVSTGRATVDAMQRWSDEEASEDDDAKSSRTPGPPDELLRQLLRSPAAVEGFKNEYWNQPDHKAFAASEDGAWGFGAGHASQREAVTKAMAQCEQNRKPYTQECDLVNVDGAWAQR